MCHVQKNWRGRLDLTTNCLNTCKINEQRMELHLRKTISLWQNAQTCLQTNIRNHDTRAREGDARFRKSYCYMLSKTPQSTSLKIKQSDLTISSGILNVRRCTNGRKRKEHLLQVECQRHSSLSNSRTKHTPPQPILVQLRIQQKARGLTSR